jgi:transcription elongation GreA/GreB family factor
VERLNKPAIVAALLAQIDEELAQMTKIARDAAEAASHEENRSEGSKDTRATEASYIARGQAERAVELELHRKRLSSLPLRDFSSADAIESTAIIDVLHQGKQQRYFLLPVAGGRHVELDGQRISTITPVSPLGSALLGLSVGDEPEVTAPGQPKIYEIVAVI